MLSGDLVLIKIGQRIGGVLDPVVRACAGGGCARVRVGSTHSFSGGTTYTAYVTQTCACIPRDKTPQRFHGNLITTQTGTYAREL